MKNAENKKPLFKLGLSTEFLNEVERKEDLIKSTIQEKLDIIDKSEHLTSKDKMSKILNIRRKEERNWHIKTLVSSGLFNRYIIHCEYLVYACKYLSDFEAEGDNLIVHHANRLSSYLKELKKYDLKHIENLISKVDNSFSQEETDEDYELLLINNSAFTLFSSAEKVDSFDKMYRRQQKYNNILTNNDEFNVWYMGNYQCK